MNSDYVSLYKDSIILGRLYPLECEKADKEHAAGSENRLRKQFLGEDVEEKEFKDKWLEFRQMLRKKYKGKEIIRPID